MAQGPVYIDTGPSDRVHNTAGFYPNSKSYLSSFALRVFQVLNRLSNRFSYLLEYHLP